MKDRSILVFCYQNCSDLLWENISPVHVVLVSLLVDQLSSLFLPFFGRPKKNLFSLREFLVRLWFFWSTKFLFGIPKFLFSIPKNQSLTKKNSETDQKFPETGQFFLVDQKKMRNRPDNWVPSMWFWSVSWSTNCPVYFSLFLVHQKKIVQSEGIFGQSLNFFWPGSDFLVY